MAILGCCSSFHEPHELEHRLASMAEEDVRASAENAERGYFAVGAHAASEEGFAIVLQGRPRWQNERIDAADVLALYRAHGADFLPRLGGTFALCIYDPSSARVVLAVDRMGVERLTYFASAGALWFGTKVTEVRALSGTGAPVSNQSIYDYLFFHMVPSPRTIFEGIEKLPPAHMLEWSNGRATQRRYWAPSFAAGSASSDGNLERALCTVLEASVRRTYDPDTRTGAFLSGGLDSSTVAGYLARVAAAQVDTFSIGFDIAAYDELEYARVAAAHFNTRSHEYYVTPADIVDVFERVVQSYDEPFGNSSVIPTYYCARVAKESGMDHLMAGDGGDELFAGNERYARQRIFEAYGVVPRWLRTKVIEPAMQLLSPLDAVSPVRKLRRYVEQARVPLPRRYGANFAFNAGLINMISPEFAQAIDAERPVRHMNEVYAAAEADTVLDRLLLYDWRLTLADNDLRKVVTMCELAGIRVSFPMLDDELVFFSTGVPAAKKMRGTKLRSFYKQALRDFLPREVLEKRKHGFGLPFGAWLKTDVQLRDLFYSLLSDLKRRNVFKPEFIDDVIGLHRSGSAAYYGYFIWDLAVLEQWLKSHADGK